jgi:hypothetical protein
MADYSDGFGGGEPVVAMVPPNSQKKKNLGCIYIYFLIPVPSHFFSLLWSLPTLHPGSVPGRLDTNDCIVSLLLYIMFMFWSYSVLLRDVIVHNIYIKFFSFF